MTVAAFFHSSVDSDFQYILQLVFVTILNGIPVSFVYGGDKILYMRMEVHGKIS